MKNLTAETITGFNTFLSDQKKVEGEATLTLATFSSDYTLVHDCTPLEKVSELTTETYRASGWTALLDALGRTINATGAKLAAMKEEDRPSKVIFVIMTDGEENYSKEFTREKIFEMITHQRDKYSWEFVFLGANQDAIKAGTSLGVSGFNSVAYIADSAGIHANYSSISSNMTAYRNGGAQQVSFFDQGVSGAPHVVDQTKTTPTTTITTTTTTTKS